MKTLKWITALVIIFATSFSVNAQRNQYKQRPMQDSAQMAKRMDRIITELNLSDKQTKAFEALHTEHLKEVKATKDKYAASREKERAEMKAHRDDFEKELADVLSEDQLTKFKELKQQPRGRGNGGKQGNRGPQGKCDGTGPRGRY